MNTRQDNQAQNTPFGTGYLADCIGFNKKKSAAVQILHGTFIPNPDVTLLPETHKVIEYLKKSFAQVHPFSQPKFMLRR
jgi:hypothetical protein